MTDAAVGTDDAGGALGAIGALLRYAGRERLLAVAVFSAIVRVLRYTDPLTLGTYHTSHRRRKTQKTVAVLAASLSGYVWHAECKREEKSSDDDEG